MKISSEYVKTFRTMYNRLRREFPKPRDREFETLPEDATETLILGILATNDLFSRARQAARSLRDRMVDYNELRVTPTVELVELLEPHLIDPQRAAGDLVKTLNTIFNRFDTFDLSELKDRSKSELTRLFEDIPGCPDHARCTMLLFSFEIPTVPLDDRMLEFLVAGQALPAEIDVSLARQFIERRLKAAQIGAFYWQLRKATEAELKSSRRTNRHKKDDD